ncbi:hypothetical protein [Paenibacillus sp. GCM10027626]|uniref:hypothetical protein n=1 Tax=Paenibacillus sp. GCM10027626 TaxID=3273411 RepID=UPI0036352080
MVIDLQAYKDNKARTPKPAVRRIPVFERVFVKDGKLIGETAKGTQLIIKDYAKEDSNGEKGDC